MTAIKDARKQRGLTQTELAQLINVTQGAISQWENGNSRPTLDNLVAIARALGCKVDDLIKEE